MTDAISAYGTDLQMGDGADPEVFTTIAEVRTIGGPGLSKNALDVTAHSSPDGYMEFIAGLKDGGEITLGINYVPDDPTHDPATGLLAAYESVDSVNFKLIFPDAGATTWSIPALVTGFEPSSPVEAELSASVTLKVSGKPTLA